VAAVQDINPKVTGALFLREFVARYPAIGVGAATRVLVPGATASAETIRSLLSQFSTAEQPCEEIAVVPGRLGDDRHVCTNLSIGWRSGANPGADACRRVMSSPLISDCNSSPAVLDVNTPSVH
jgi:hypothetical protein